MKFDFLAITLEKKNIENLEIKKEEEWIFETKKNEETRSILLSGFTHKK